MKLLVLDRDGVINYDSDVFIKSPREWQPIPGSLEAIGKLHRAGWTIVVATNQSGLARGLFDAAALEAIHQRLRDEAARHGGAIDAIFVCPHGPDAGCSCRKPKPGLLHAVAARYRVELRDVPCAGDSLRDLEAAAACGCRPLLVLTGKGRETQKSGGLPEGTEVFADLACLAEHLGAVDSSPAIQNCRSPSSRDSSRRQSNPS